MNPRNTVRSRILLLLFLLSIPALACTTLPGGSDDGDTVGSADESQQASSPEEQESVDDSNAGDEGAAESAAAESTAGSGEASVDSRETIVSALRTGLEIDRMRMYITSEDASIGAVTDITLTIVRPNRYHLVSEELELVVIDDTTYLKGPDGEWTTMPGTEMISTVEGTLASFTARK